MLTNDSGGNSVLELSQMGGHNPAGNVGHFIPGGLSDEELDSYVNAYSTIDL